MSQRLIGPNPDLKRLRDEGYDVAILANHLVIRQVPYVTAARDVRRGVLISTLEMSGEKTNRPQRHEAYWVGDYPCDNNGAQLTRIVNSASRVAVDKDITTDFLLSTKHPDRHYLDYHDKMTRYVTAFESYAQAIDSSVTAKVFPAVRTDDTESVFWYIDTASSRSGITAITQRLELPAVAIVGVGGTGSYVLDLISKTPIRAIHLFDGDQFSNHNAFRSPRAASLEELDSRPSKAQYFARHYSQMHRHIVPHEHFIDASNVHELFDMSFVFLCMDKGAPKAAIVAALTERKIPFTDVGLGVQVDSHGTLGGQARITTSSPRLQDHIVANHRISFGVPEGDDDYASNIQIADLNALNAALAVIKWKKLFGFYRDLEDEHYSVYDIDGNCITNDDRP